MRVSLIFCFCLCIILLKAQTSNLYGLVLDEEGEPYVGLIVELEDIDMKDTTDEEGFYKFLDVPVGDYPMVVRHPYGDVYRAIYMDGADLEYNVEVRRRIEFDQVTVAATRSGATEPVTRSDIGRTEILQNDFSQDLTYMLKRSASVFVNSDAGTGIGYTGLRIRGVDPSHINVTLNGIPVNDAESQLVFWVNMPDLLSSTESIEIQKGLGGSSFGAGDFGASISVNTNQVRTKSYIEATAGVGSFNTRRGTLAMGTGLMNNRFTVDGRLSYIRSDGYIDRARANLDGFYISGAWIGLNSSLRLNVINGHEVTYQAWNGVPVTFADDRNLRTFNSAGQEAFQPGSSFDHHQQPWDDEVDNYTQTHVQLFFNHTNDLGDWTSSLHYTRGLGFFELYQAQADVVAYNAQLPGDTVTSLRDLVERRWLDNHFVGANASWNKQFGKLDIRAAVAYNAYLGDHFGETIILPDAGRFDPPRTYYENDATKTDFNIFTKSLYHLTDNWKAYLDLQYRRVGYDYGGEVRFDRDVIGEATFNFFNPKIGLTYLPNKKTKVYGYYGRGNKEPNRDDFIDSPAGQEPVSEKMNNIELGINQAHNKLSWGLTAYAMQYTDQLVLTGRINDVGEYARTNVDESHRMGIEAEFGVQPLSGLTISGNVTWSQNQIANYSEFIDDWETGQQIERRFENTPMALSPDWIGFLGLRYDWANPFGSEARGRLSIALDHKYVGQQFLDNTGSEDAALDEFVYADASIEYATSWSKLRIKEVVLRFKVMNVYNTLYSTSGWNYRFRTPDPDWVDSVDRPYLRSEGGEIFTLTGLFPQAPLHFQSAISVRF